MAEQIDDPEETAATVPPDAPGQLAVEVRYEPDTAFVTAVGEIDVVTAPRLAAAVEETLRTNVRHIAIDLTGTTFMDSTGIHVLVQAQERARQDVAVICGPGPVLRTLELLGLAAPLNVVPSLDVHKRRRSGS